MNKTFLNALIILLGVFVVILVILSTYFSDRSNNCNYEVNKLLINKTQQFVEKQYLLFYRTWAIDARNANAAAGNIEEAANWDENVVNPYKEYKKFVENITGEDARIGQRMDNCKTQENYSNFCLTLALIIATAQFIFSVIYLRKYH